MNFLHEPKDWPRMPRVGDKVRLNDCGIETCFGFTHGLAHMKTKTFTLTNVDPESQTHPEPTYLVEVDDPELNEMMLSHWCFDLVEAA